MVKPIVNVDPQQKLRAALSKAAKECQDLTPALILIAQYWRKSNEAIFSLKGPGKYPDLSPKYKAYKESILGSAYPIMMFTGRIMASITGEPNEESIQKIINGKSLTLGTSVPYADMLAHNESKPRPVVLFGNEAVAGKALNTRIAAWERILLTYVAQKSGAKV